MRGGETKRCSAQRTAIGGASTEAVGNATRSQSGASPRDGLAGAGAGVGTSIGWAL